MTVGAKIEYVNYWVINREGQEQRISEHKLN